MTAKTTDTLASAMAQAFAEIDAAAKGNENPAFKREGKALKYADINAVIEAIKPALINHGLFFTQRPEPHERGVQIETVLHHAGGETLSLGTLFVPADANNAQKFGSALTYARRYALVTAFGVPVEDDDGNAASAPKAQDRPAPPALITEDQRNELMDLFASLDLCASLGINQARLLAKASENTGQKVETLADLPASEFAGMRAYLLSKQAAKPADTLADDAAFLGEGA
jgi:hypothetical protein